MYLLLDAARLHTSLLGPPKIPHQRGMFLAPLPRRRLNREIPRPTPWQLTCWSQSELPVKLSVIALDYDGTVARDDILDPSVREAIAAARTRGIVVLLVTGRILDELRRVAGDLHFVDGVIAENGAVIHFPDSGRTSALAPLVPETFVAELRRRRIPFAAGQCLVDAMRTRRRACSRSFERSNCHSCSSSTAAV